MVPKLGRFLRRARQRHLSVEARRYRCTCVYEAERLAQPSAGLSRIRLKRSRRGYGRTSADLPARRATCGTFGENGTQTVIAATFDGKRFNSPNDLAIRKNGDVYFTDPPYGLANFNESPLKELPHNGVYRVNPKGEVTLLISDLTWPNGIAFSPDEKTLYVAVSDPGDPRIMAYEVQPDGTVANGRTLFDKPLRGQGRPRLAPFPA